MYNYRDTKSYFCMHETIKSSFPLTLQLSLETYRTL